jgi:hypothetical protein
MDKVVATRILKTLTGQTAYPADELRAEIHCTTGDLLELATVGLVQFRTLTSDQFGLTITPEGIEFLMRLLAAATG